PNCDSPFSENEEKCSTCGEYLGYLNVRAATRPGEVNELQKRYETVMHRAAARGAQDIVSRFETAVRSSFAVIGCDIYVIRDLIVANKLYSNYYLRTRAQVRRLAQDEYDRRRRVVDAALFGAYSEHIVFAALSLDGMGLRSYGAYSVVLRDIAVSKRS